MLHCDKICFNHSGNLIDIMLCCDKICFNHSGHLIDIMLCGDKMKCLSKLKEQLCIIFNKEFECKNF